MGRIPDHIIEQVKDAADIVDVIGKHVQLKRAGSEFKGLCPFHDEKTPSFGISPSKRAYYCFGCGSGGSVIRFLQDYHNLPFPEAIKQLATEYGIQIVEETFDPEFEKTQKTSRSTETVQQGCRQLVSPPSDEKFMRGDGTDLPQGAGELPPKSQNAGGLGFAPAGQAIVTWAEENGYSIDVMAQAGLVGYRDENNPRRGALSSLSRSPHVSNLQRKW